jgi:pyruvate kinase
MPPQCAALKIICTIGPATESAEMLRKLVEAGADVFRLNFSHGTVGEHQSTMRRIRAVAEETGKPVAILQDLPGPKIRLGVFNDGSVELHAGDRFRLTTDEVPGDHEHASISYSQLPDEVRSGQSILLVNGTVELEVESVTRSEIVSRVVLGGVLTSQKGVSVVGGTSSLCAFTERDQKLLLCGLEAGVDLVALSFVRSPVDILSARSFLAARQANLPLMAKIEKLESLDIINEILAVADSIMVARGDLGIEVAIAQVPHIQKELISKAMRAAKPVVTATHWSALTWAAGSPGQARRRSAISGAGGRSDRNRRGAPVRDLALRRSIRPPSTGCNTPLLRSSGSRRPQSTAGCRHVALPQRLLLPTTGRERLAT